MLINVVRLKRYFGRSRAVDDLSFSFSEGQIYGFIGPNGAGKTTTMRVMATLDEPTSGDVFLDGISVVQDPEKARRVMGFVPDTLPTHRDMTVHEYIDFFARAYGIRGNRRRQVVGSIEEFTGLMGLREKMLKALSKGMKQRVNLARALVHDPAVLVMDEPAAGLDPRARVELRELVKVLASQGKADWRRNEAAAWRPRRRELRFATKATKSAVGGWKSPKGNGYAWLPGTVE